MNMPVDNPPDERVFEQALERTKAHGFLEYRGEFGGEVANFIPFVHWLHQHRHLRNTRLSTYRGMEPFYFFLQPDQLLIRNERRVHVPNAERWWPGSFTHTDISASPFHAPPDYRAHYTNSGLSFSRPIIFIQNKFNAEWDVGPINFLALRFLREMFQLGESRFSVVYSRPMEVMSSGYSQDHNINCDYPDYALAEQFPDVTCLDRLDLGDKYNETKLSILAKCKLFLSVQGGSTHLLAYFGGSILIVHHVVGPEFPRVYFEGRYTQLSSPPPKIFLFDSRTDDIGKVVGFFKSLRTTAGRSCEVGRENLLWLEPLTEALQRPSVISRGKVP